MMTFLLFFMLTTVAASSSILIKHAGEETLHGQRRLHQIAALLYSIEGQEWSALRVPARPIQVQAQIATDFAAIDVLLNEAREQGLSATGAENLRRSIAVYREAVATEIPLIVAGDIPEAMAYDQEYVDPAFAEVERILGKQVAVMNARAERRSRQADLGMLLSIAVPLLVVSRLLIVRSAQDIKNHLSARYQALIERSSDLVIVVEDGGKITFQSPSAIRVLRNLGFDDEVSIAEIIHPRDRATIEALIAGKDTGEPVDVRIGRRNTWRLLEVEAQDLRSDPAVGGMVLTGRDITDRYRLERQLTHQAIHDALTGLPNRGALVERLSEILAMPSERHAALILVDLDRFKDINDALGHRTGDLVIVHVGQRLLTALPEVDMVCRLGGDEFAILFTTDDLASAKDVGERIRQAVAEPFIVDGAELQIDASLGIVLQGEHGDDASTLLRRADTAMYVAKERGVGVFVYDPLADQNHPDRLILLAELRRAISAGDLLLHYQPQINVRTGELVGAEALVRWWHPERGLIPPDTFIPLAEQTGLIAPLTESVLQMAIRQARCWMDAGAHLRVSVNLSWRNLDDDDFDQKVAELLAQHQVPAHLLLLEVTESAIMSQTGNASEVFQRLRAIGVHLAIDDFGAGYTSLAQLKNLPVDELKVDRSFVITMSTERSNDLIVRSVVDLGQNLGLRTVAEGVEDAEALRRLGDYGCDVAQGYHLSRPLAVPDFDQWRASLPRPATEQNPYRSREAQQGGLLLPRQRDSQEPMSDQTTNDADRTGAV